MQKRTLKGEEDAVVSKHTTCPRQIIEPSEQLQYFLLKTRQLKMKVEFTKEDCYGQKHPIESDQLIQIKLKELEVELEKIPSDEKELWEQAKTKCPDLADDEHRLMFLRCEVFNADVSDY